MLKKKPYSGFSSVYDAVMREVQYRRWSEFILSSYSAHCETIFPKSILDLGCGTCRLWEEFPDLVELTGIDSSSEMLEIARKKEIGGELILSDLLQFDLSPRKFDLILSTHDTLNYLNDERELKQVFSKIRSHLAPDGIFFFDISSLYNFKNHFDGQTFVERAGDYKIRWVNRFLEEEHVLESTLTFSHKRTDEEFTETHVHRYFPRNTIHQLLRECGLFLLEEGSDYEDWILKEDASLVNYLCGNSEIYLRNR
ncbi:class I SAM-dependent methyltransferase [Leptospira yasudae]|uniref:class I SAM-dependent DNA methyltransferase n=1 Tax=Leptospira yasudae TaxID=2202201 RepID=UPI001082FB90|nr:class I SAM-dependent methyltransferase [Leptospira yasudae]TGK25850.1 class I SAM-dependent methyltransferase [Leptospira yasudae]TGM02950.1 class I SAM-dependent methyltransferase [Leptospira yasudae]